MFLPPQMTQRGGICSDSPRITYTPAAGGSADTPLRANPPPSRSRREREGKPGLPPPHPWQPGRAAPPCGLLPAPSHLQRRGNCSLSYRAHAKRKRLFLPLSVVFTNANMSAVSSLSKSTFEPHPKKKKKKSFKKRS